MQIADEFCIARKTGFLTGELRPQTARIPPLRFKAGLLWAPTGGGRRRKPQLARTAPPLGREKAGAAKSEGLKKPPLALTAPFRSVSRFLLLSRNKAPPPSCPFGLAGLAPRGVISARACARLRSVRFQRYGFPGRLFLPPLLLLARTALFLRKLVRWQTRLCALATGNRSLLFILAGAV